MKPKIWLATVLVVPFFVCSCSEKERSNDDPKADSEVTIKRFIPRLQQILSTPVIENAGKFGITFRLSDDYSYDVVKTDSLVSPFLGKLKLKVPEYLVIGDEIPYGFRELELTFAFQNKKWVLTTIDARPNRKLAPAPSMEWIEKPDITNDPQHAGLVTRIREAFQKSQEP